MSEPIIEVRHLSKSFGTHVVLRDVDFTVKPGDVTCVIGASGSGKSTLLRCINLLETPTAGSILFHGQDIMAKGFDPCGYRARVGMVFQSFNLFNNMTVLENCTAGLRYVLHQDKETAKATALSNLEKVGMSPYIHARPRQLSGGQKQRVAIARMLMQKAPIMVFDDSLSAVDAETDVKIRHALKERMGKSTVILISHRVTTLMQADCILVLEDGRVAQMGTHQQLMEETDGIYRRIYDIQMNVDDELLRQEGVKQP